MRTDMPLKVAVVLGTRPEIIRLSRVIAALDQACELTLIHTGQNYDHELNDIFFEELDVRRPDHYLNAAGSTLGETVGAIIARTEPVLQQISPDAMLVLGDTNSALSAYVARRLRIPVYHMEAGNRCFDRNVPEETNRTLVDHISDFNLAYTEHGRRNLLAEGLPARRIYVTGSPMREVLEHHRARIEGSDAVARLGLTDGAYCLASLHREENVDSEIKLSNLVDSLRGIADAFDEPVVVSTHPRTRARLDAAGLVPEDERIRWLKPFGFFDYNRLQMSARCVLSDSGTIAEEASILGFAGVTPRLSIERPEAMDTGTVIVCGNQPIDIVRTVRYAVDALSGTARFGVKSLVPVDYSIDNTSQRVVNLIMGTARLSNQWDGIDERNASRI